MVVNICLHFEGATVLNREGAAMVVNVCLHFEGATASLAKE